jgi:hypothetical protein
MILHEAQCVAVSATTEAVVKPLLWYDSKAAGFLVVKRAQTSPLATGAPQLDDASDQRGQIDARFNSIDPRLQI